MSIVEHMRTYGARGRSRAERAGDARERDACLKLAADFERQADARLAELMATTTPEALVA